MLDKVKSAAEKGITNHSVIFDKIPDHEKAERELIKNIFQFIQKKWLFEIVHALAFHERLYFNEIKKHLGSISSKTLSERLKELQEINIVTRRVEDTTAQVRVSYSLTEHGKGLHHTFIPFVIYYFSMVM